MNRILAFILVLMLCFSLAGIAEDNATQGSGGNRPEGIGQGELPQGGPGGARSDDMGKPMEGMGAPSRRGHGNMDEGDVASTGNATNTTGVIDVTNGTATADESLMASIGEADGIITISSSAKEIPHN